MIDHSYLIDIGYELYKKAEDPKSDKCQNYLRSCMSRSYYGAFTGCRKLVENKLDTSGVTGSSHEKVIKCLGKYPRFRRIAQQLDEIRLQRNAADYEWDVLVTDQDARSVLRRARSIQGELFQECS